MGNLVSQTTYTGTDLSTSKSFTLSLTGVSGKQWYAIAAATGTKQYAFTNPIWVNGPDVSRCMTITDIHEVITYPVAPVAGSSIELPPTAILTTTPWTGFLLADWIVSPGCGHARAGRHATYIYTLTFTAPAGTRFARELSQPENGRKVSCDGRHLVYRVQLKALPKSE
jgi:hypothetical protein